MESLTFPLWTNAQAWQSTKKKKKGSHPLWLHFSSIDNFSYYHKLISPKNTFLYKRTANSYLVNPFIIIYITSHLSHIQRLSYILQVHFAKCNLLGDSMVSFNPCKVKEGSTLVFSGILFLELRNSAIFNVFVATNLLSKIIRTNKVNIKLLLVILLSWKLE